MSDWRPTQPNYQVPATTASRVGAMTLADIVDTSFKLFKANWKDLAKAILIFSIPVMIFALLQAIFTDGQTITDLFTDLQDGSTSSGANGLGAGWIAASAIFQIIDSLFIASLLTAVVSRILAADYLGQPITAGTSIRGLKGKWLTTAGASLAYYFLIAGVVIVSVIPFVLLAFISPWLSILGIVAIVPIVYVVIVFTLYLQVIAIEEAGIVQSLSRSYNLVKRRFWPYFGTIVVIGLVTNIFAGIVQFVIGLIGGIFGQIAEPLSYPFTVFNTFVGQMIAVPIIAGAFTLIYFDARVRFEGFDIELAAQNNEQQPQQPLS